jgi:hypothetical protein
MDGGEQATYSSIQFQGRRLYGDPSPASFGEDTKAA